MMKLKSTLSVVSIAILSGCASMGGDPARSIVGDALNFSTYKNENDSNASRTGIAQVFEMDGKTVLQMRAADKTRPQIVDEAGNPVEYTTTGTYIILQRPSQKLVITQDGQTATIARALNLPIPAPKGERTAQPAPSPGHPKVSGSLNSLPSSDMTSLANDIDARDRYMKAIESLQAQLNDLRAALASLGPVTEPSAKKVDAGRKRALVSRSRQARGKVVVQKPAASSAAAALSDNEIAKQRADAVRGISTSSSL